ncbi:MAG: SDR family NAD(P)-dependent oxidoreductase [Alphaproteobacteria bacterium]
MFEEFKNKVVLITGSSTGIGAAAALAFGRYGAHVVVHYARSADKAEAVAEKIRAMGAQATVIGGDMAVDGGAEAVVRDAIAKAGDLHILVNNAGHMVERRPFADYTDAAFAHVVNLNARSAVAASAAALPQFKKNGRGNIIHVSSIAARNGGSGGAGFYAATKGFVSTMTHGMAREFAPLNIRVNAVSPGVILTPFHEMYSNEQQLAAAKATIPMDRLGVAEDCAGTFLYLASDAMSGYVTGQVIEVNGGQYMP